MEPTLSPYNPAQFSSASDPKEGSIVLSKHTAKPVAKELISRIPSLDHFSDAATEGDSAKGKCAAVVPLTLSKPSSTSNDQSPDTITTQLSLQEGSTEVCLQPIQVPFAAENEGQRELRHFFGLSQIAFQPSTTLDRALLSLHQMGHHLTALSEDPQKHREAYESAKKVLEIAAKQCFESELPKGKEEISATTYQAQNAKNLLKEIRGLLISKVFLFLDEPIDSPHNKKILRKLVPDSEVILKGGRALGNSQQSDAMEKETSLINKIAAFTRIVPSTPVLPETPRYLPNASDLLLPSHVPFEKLSSDYDYLKSVQKLLDAYRSALRQLCTVLQNDHKKVIKRGLVKLTIPERILFILNNKCSFWDTVNLSQSDFIKQMIDQIVKLIEQDYLMEFETHMVLPIRRCLIRNFQERPHELSSFEDFRKKLIHQLFIFPLANVSDIKRVMENPNFFLKIFVQNVEVSFSSIPSERYATLLKTFGTLFGQPTMFTYLAEQISACLEIGADAETGMYPNYEMAYSKMLFMSESEKMTIKTNFEAIYGNGTFEKALRYFHFCQNCLGQGIIYFFNAGLNGLRVSKFRSEDGKRGLISPKLSPDLKKNEVIIRINGKTCEIQYLRRDGLFAPEAILIQEYSIFIDTAVDFHLAPVKLKMTIECPTYLPAENDDLRNALFDLPLLMESMNFPPLEIRYIESIAAAEQQNEDDEPAVANPLAPPAN